MGIVKALALSLLICGTAAQSQYTPGGRGSGFGGGSSGGYEGGADGTGNDPAGGNGGSLEETIPGTPGDDYPIFAEVPETSFLCDGQADGGYYADPEAECQAFHICANDGNGGLTKYSFLCPNGTLFQQQYFVCDWWFNVDCSLAEQLYSLNDEIAAERAANSPEGAGEYQGGAGGAGGRAGSGGRGGAGGRRGGSGGSQGAASSPRGSYSAPSGAGGFGGGQDFGVDAGYGAPGGVESGYGAPGAGSFGGSSLGGYSSRRRNARDLELSAIEDNAILDKVMNVYE